MEEILNKIKTERQRKYQKKYRQRQHDKQLVRLELQLEAQYKQRFDELVAAKAKDYPYDIHQQRCIALARRQVLQEALANTETSFISLRDQIEALKIEIRALSPSFFKTDHEKTLPLPEAIKALPDNPQQLKVLLAKFHREIAKENRTIHKLEENEKRYRELYEAQYNENERLKKLFE